MGVGECGADLAGERDRYAELFLYWPDDPGGRGEQESAANHAAALDHGRDLGVGGQAVPVNIVGMTVVGHGRVVVKDGQNWVAIEVKATSVDLENVDDVLAHVIDK